MSKAANNSRHDTYKSMQYRPALKIQSQIFNESHLDMHTEVQVFLYPKITGKKSEKFALVKICYDFQRNYLLLLLPRISLCSILSQNYQHLKHTQ